MVDCLLGIDIGTTATKAILAAPDGQILAETSTPSTLKSPQMGWAEEDPHEWWANVGIVCRHLLTRIPDANIVAVGVSGMVPTIVLLDRAGEPLRPSIQQNDARSHIEIAHFQRETDADDILQRTGSAITQQSIGPKLLWLRQHEPEVMQRAAHLMGSYDYINYKLTGQFSIEQNWALESGLFDVQRGGWDADIIRLSSGSVDWLGQVSAPSEIIGAVTDEAARHTGLKPGTPVVAGSADHVASAYTAGLKTSGDLLVKLGGAGDILMVIDRFQPEPRLFIDYHVIPGQFLINGCMAASGSIIKWFQAQFAHDADYAQLDAEAADIAAGADGLLLLPYFLGEKTPVFDPIARGVLFGLTLTHTRAHVFRAVLEAISFGFYHHLQVLAESHLYPNPTVMVTNGGAHSALWRQVTADVLGLTLHSLAQHPGSSLGAMFVAGMGAGVFGAWSEIDRFLVIDVATQPDLRNHEKYRRLFPLYQELYQRNRPLFEKVNDETAR
jgi:xylulokinase